MRAGERRTGIVAPMKVQIDIDIERPADEVFAYLSDFSHNPEWQQGMVSAEWTSPAPYGVGSTYRQLARFLGRRVMSTFQVVEWDPPHRVTIETLESSFPIRVTRTVASLGPSRSRASAYVAGDASGFFRIAEPMMRWMVRRSVAADYRRLKSRLESEQA